MEFDHLFTERLTLRMLTPSVYNYVFEHYSDVDLKSFFGFSTDIQLEVERNKHVGGMTGYNRTFLLFQLILKDNETIIGSCGLHNWFPEHRRSEIGYVLLSDQFKQKGFMGEALEAILEYGFNTLNLNRIEACISPSNIASLRLIEKMKFTREAVLKQHFFKNDLMHDSVIYALLKENY